MKDLIATMKTLAGELDTLEAGREAEKDAAKGAEMDKAIAAKKTEFDVLEAKVAAARAKEERAKSLAALEERDKVDTATKDKLLDAKVADSDHNKRNDQRMLDAKSWEILIDPRAKGFEQARNELEGNMREALTPERKTQTGVKAPSFMSKLVLPQPTGIAELGLIGKTEYNVLSNDATGSQSGGASIVPDTFENRLYRLPQRLDDIPSRCWVKRAVTGNALYPKLAQSTNPFGIAVAWTAEGGILSTSNPVFSQVSVATHRCQALSYISLKALRDNRVGLEGELAWMYRSAFSRSLSSKILEGTGTLEPQGVNSYLSFTGGVVRTARAVAAQVSIADLNNLQFATEDGMIDEGIFVLSAGSTGAMKYISSLLDSYGRPLFANLEGGGQNTGRQARALLGAEFIRTKANTKTLGSRGDVIFGDFRQYALPIEYDSLSIDRSDDFAFNYGLITYRLEVYVGGIPLGYTCFAVLDDVAGISSSSSSSST